MKIKDVELETGISKANIRYYESQGLITTTRSENGYRTYTQAHVEQLHRIKLLRMLDIPIATIQDLSEGKTNLSKVLLERKAQFQNQHQTLNRSEEVIHMLLDSDVDYGSLDPAKFLTMMTDEVWELRRKRLKTFRRYTFVVFSAMLLLFLLLPSPSAANKTGISASKIFLSQLRSFLVFPLCVSSGACICFASLYQSKGCRIVHSSRRRWICLAVLAVMVLLGGYWCIGFIGFQILPPIPFSAGLYIMRNPWVLSIWWVTVAFLLTEFIAHSSDMGNKSPG